MKKVEYQVRKKAGLWCVIHIHEYPNYNYAHLVYQGSSWEFCMWIATGQLSYIEFMDEDYFRRNALNVICGNRPTRIPKVYNGYARTSART